MKKTSYDNRLYSFVKDRLAEHQYLAILNEYYILALRIN